jgi:DNA-binding MurR/RpiR family transcriptional regulator
MLFIDHKIELDDLDLHIYKYIIANLEKVPYMRIRELAAETNVSTTSILRFCKKFECDGYSEFKYRLKNYIKEAPQETIEPDMKMIASFFDKFNAPAYLEVLDEAIDAILDSDFILFIGKGASGMIAAYGAQLFSSLVCFSIAVDDLENVFLHEFKRKFENKMCLIVLSVSGNHDDIIDFISDQSVANSKVIAITNTSTSKLAKVADLSINYFIPEQHYDQMNITSQVPALTILEYLAKKAHAIKYKKG